MRRATTTGTPASVPRVAADEDTDGTETGRACALDQLEPALRVGGEHGRREVAERRRDSALAAGHDLDPLERQLLSLLRECARRGRQSLPLRQRQLHRRHALAREHGAGFEIVLLAVGGTRRRIGLVGGALELEGRRAPAAPTGLRELSFDLDAQALGRLVTHRQTLRRPAQGEQGIPAAAGEQSLRLAAPGQDRIELRGQLGLGAALGRGDPGPLLLGLELRAGELGRGLLGGRSGGTGSLFEPRRRARIVVACRIELGRQARRQQRRRLAAERDPLAASTRAGRGRRWSPRGLLRRR